MGVVTGGVSRPENIHLSDRRAFFEAMLWLLIGHGALRHKEQRLPGDGVW